MAMTLISDSAALAEFCHRQRKAPFIAVDTEFLRDKTYWPHLCLIQIAGPSEAAAIDCLVKEMDLSPLYDLLFDPNVLKVFHAGRQDVEIFYHRLGRVPEPCEDTQIMAMVCGFGESVGYEGLIQKLLGVNVDKSSRFTDWSQRPLSDKQMRYALADVVHLRTAYELLTQQIENSGRKTWIAEEMGIFRDPSTYSLDPRESWRRLKPRSDKGRYLAILREIAAWRETEARRRNIPRGRVLRDDVLVEIAAGAPQTIEALARLRGLNKGFADSPDGTAVLSAIETALALPRAEWPTLPSKSDQTEDVSPIVELLRLLLKICSTQSGVAPKLLANTDDLYEIALRNEAKVPALTGWRYDIFGRHALDMKHGRIALGADQGRVAFLPVGGLKD